MTALQTTLPTDAAPGAVSMGIFSLLVGALSVAAAVASFIHVRLFLRLL
jgi:hypothetical protein